MVNLIQCQSTASHPTQMRVDVRANSHGFGDKHLFYLLFVRPTSFHVAGGSIFSLSGVGMVPVILSGYPTLH